MFILRLYLYWILNFVYDFTPKEDRNQLFTFDISEQQKMRLNLDFPLEFKSYQMHYIGFIFIITPSLPEY